LQDHRSFDEQELVAMVLTDVVETNHGGVLPKISAHCYSIH
jgi:hypothetical protein